MQPITSPVVGFCVRQKSSKFSSFYVFTANAKEIVHYVAQSELQWDSKESQFSGFNRSIDSHHTARISKFLQEKDAVLPNPILLYIKSECFHFDALDKDMQKSIIPGSITLKSEQKLDSKGNIIKNGDETVPEPIGFIIDGQHRISAFSKYQWEKNEEFPILICAFVPETQGDADKLERFLLDQMDNLNSSKPLSEEEHRIIKRKLQAVKGIKRKEYITDVANLIVGRLDTKEPFGYIKLKQRKVKLQYIPIEDKVLNKVISYGLDHVPVVKNIFKKINEPTPKELDEAAEKLGKYFTAVKSIFGEKHWQASKNETRLWGYPGLYCMLRLMDHINDIADIAWNSPSVLLQLKKELKYVSQINWTCSPIVSGEDGTPDLDRIGMAQIEFRKNIEVSLYENVKQLYVTARRIHRKEERDVSEFEIVVKDSEDIVVHRQKINLDLEYFQDLDEKLETDSIFQNWSSPKPVSDEEIDEDR